jgi:hypothetical protein
VFHIGNGLIPTFERGNEQCRRAPIGSTIIRKEDTMSIDYKTTMILLALAVLASILKK